MSYLLMRRKKLPQIQNLKTIITVSYLMQLLWVSNLGVALLGGSDLETFMSCIHGGTWVAQLVKHLTVDFGSGHDFTVCGFGPRVAFCTDRAEPALDSLFLSLFLSLSLSLCPYPAHALALSQK